MKKIILTFSIICISNILFAQKIDVEKLQGLKIRSIGPAGMSGRVTAIDVDLSNPEIIYAGTASGGLWKSESGGIEWEPIFDENPVQSIGAVAVDQINPDIIWVGTGEGNPRNSQSSGEGIYKSLDGGRTWKFMGLKSTKTIHRIVVNKNNSEIVYVASLGSAWGQNPDRGLYKTIDGGKSWKKILFINEKTGCADLVADPTNPNKLFAAMWEYERKPYFFTSGGNGSGLYVSFDGGDSWKLITEKEGFPEGNLGRIGIAIAPSKPSIIYALVEAKKTALYKSVDGGFLWKKIADKNIGNRPFYYAEIYVDPKNENRIYNLYSVVSKSEDGGKTFEELLPYSGAGVHPDHHAFWLHPSDPDYLIEGNDGGLNISRNGGKDWRFVENLPVAQFYHINYDMEIPYNIYGGLQDNGSWCGPSQVWQSGGIRNSHWTELLFGDGFDVVPKKGDSRFGYAMSQGGELNYYDRLTGETKYIKPVQNDTTELRFNWNAGIAQDPFNTCGVYFGSQFIHYSIDCGNSWKTISPDLTTNDTTKQKQAKSGGLTIDATTAENHTTIISIAPSTLKEGIIWVGTDDGNLQLTTDGGKSWTNCISKIKDAPTGAWIPQVEPSKHNPAEAFVIINNYRQNDWNPYVFHTTDFGKSWERIVDENDVHGYALSIVQDHVLPNLLFLGTENGLYFTIDKGKIWNKWGKGFPSVSTMDLKIHPRENDLIIGTFGRAVYILDDINTLREIAKTNGTILDKPFHVFDSENKAILAEYKSVEGVRFTANANFRGDNKPIGALVSFYIKDVKSEKEKDISDTDLENQKNDKKKDEKVKITILDDKLDTIRNYSVKPDTGINRSYWNLKKNWVRYPSHSNSKVDAEIPDGHYVFPGKYKAIASYNGNIDSTFVEVVADPRIEIDLNILKDREEYILKIKSITTAAAKVVDRLKNTKETVDLIGKNLENVKEDVKKELEKNGKSIKDSADNFMLLFMTAADFEGYDHVTVRINSLLYNAYSYITSSWGTPSQNAILAIELTEKELQKTLARINHFYDTNWNAYRKKVEDAKLSIFQEMEPIILKK